MSSYQLDYTLSSKELYSALAAAKIVPKKGLSQVIRTVLLLIVMAIVGVNMTLDISYIKIGVVLEAVCVALLLLVWLLPSIAFKSAVKTIETQLNMKIKVEPGVVSFDDGAVIKMGENGSIEDYPKERIFMVSLTENPDQVYVVPYRVVDFEQFEDFKNTILFDSSAENNANVTESSDETEQTEEDPFQLSQEELEQIIDSQQALDESEYDESIFDEMNESIFDDSQENIVEQQENILAEKQDSQQQESIVEEQTIDQTIQQPVELEDIDSGSEAAEQPALTSVEPVAQAAYSQAEQAQAVEEDDEEFRLKMDFGTNTAQEDAVTENMFIEIDHQQLPLWAEMSEDVMVDVTPDMFESRPMVLPMDDSVQEEKANQSIMSARQKEMPLSVEDNDGDASELIGSRNEQAGVMQAEEETIQAEVIETEAAPAAAEQNEVVENEAVEAEVIQDESIEAESIQDEAIEAAPIEDEAAEQAIGNEIAEAVSADAEPIENDAAENEMIESAVAEAEITAEKADNDNGEASTFESDIDVTDDKIEQSEDDEEDEDFDDSLRDLIDAYLL